MRSVVTTGMGDQIQFAGGDVCVYKAITCSYAFSNTRREAYPKQSKNTKTEFIQSGILSANNGGSS